MAAARRGELSEAVRGVLLAADEPMTPGQVRDALGGQPAYTTVMTVLTRLVARGLASRQRVGRAFAYVAVTDEAELTARRMGLLLRDGADRAAVLARFVDVISAEDEKLLTELLSDDERRS